jgi:hypothetical protein
MASARFRWYWSEDVHRVWEILRRRGLVYFLFVRGVLRWGGFMFVFSVLMTLIGVFHRDLFPSALLRTASTCVMGGLAWGATTWCCNEWLYRRHDSSVPRSRADSDPPARGSGSNASLAARAVPGGVGDGQ